MAISEKHLRRMSQACENVVNDIFFLGNSHKPLIHNNVNKHIVGLTVRDLKKMKESIISEFKRVKLNWQIYTAIIHKDEDGQNSIYPFLLKVDNEFIMDLPAIYYEVMEKLSTELFGYSLFDGIKNGNIEGYGYFLFPSEFFKVLDSEESLIECMIVASKENLNTDGKLYRFNFRNFANCFFQDKILEGRFK